MTDTFNNRLTMFRVVLKFLDEALSLAIWNGKQPLIFTTRVQEARAAVEDLKEFVRRHGVVITGSAMDKAREERELEDLAFLLAMALVEFYRAAGNETEAAKFDFPITHWRQLRDNDLLAEAATVKLAVVAVSMGATAAEAKKYGLWSVAVAELTAATAEYASLVSSPTMAQSERKALTLQMRGKFQAVSRKYASMDNLVGQFGTTPEGRTFVAGYKAARIVRDAGHGPQPEETPPVEPTPPTP